MLPEYEDRLTITTPEGVDLDLRLAGMGSRFAAALIDWLLQMLILAALAIAFFGVGGVLGGDTGLGIGAALWFIAYFLVIFGYDILFEVLANGRTPGKRWNGLRVVRTGGQPIGFLSSAIRNLLRIVDMLPGFYAVGCISILATPRNQRLGDLAAGTLVVRERGGDEEVALQTPKLTVPAPTGAWDVATITADELTTVRSFLDRRWQIEPSSRAEIAETLAAALRPKVGGATTHLSPETFLEQVVAQKAARAQ